MVGDGSVKAEGTVVLELDSVLEAELTVALELDSMEVEATVVLEPDSVLEVDETSVLELDSVLEVDPTVVLEPDSVLEDVVDLDSLLEDVPVLEQAEKVTGEGIWGGGCLDDGLHHADLFIDVDQPCIFFEDFPPIPDFSCMSSSSSTASNLAPVKPFVASSTASSSGTASWGFMEADLVKNLLHAEGEGEQPFNLDPMETGEDDEFFDIGCLENFGYIDLMDPNDIWDPSSIFQNDEVDQNQINLVNYEDAKKESEELTAMFLEWVQVNREYFRPDDMQTIKLRKSTIDLASKKLGSSKEGKKKLLKLILEWVEKTQLQGRRRIQNLQVTNQMNGGGGGPIFTPAPATWIQPQQPYPVMPGYMAPDPYSLNQYPTPADQYHYRPNVMEPPQMWMPPPPPMNGNFTGVLGNQQQYPYPPHYYNGTVNGEKLLRLGPSATKEARQKRMARQRKNHSHRTRRNRQNQNQNAVVEQRGMMNRPENFPNGNNSQTNATPVNWAQNFPPPPPLASVIPVMAPGNNPAQQQQRLVQGLKPEKNLKLLLQKVLKQSDVGSLGRIVLPKREAENHLPELQARDGIPIAMEDIATSRIWNMRFRFWPNNKSRMYLLENTGEFVRVNELKEGDFIVLYSDVKSGKYLIRGVKVREAEKKTEVKKKPAKGHKNQRSFVGRTSRAT